MTTKICSKCNQAKSLEDFYKNTSRYDGLQGWCKECVKKHQHDRNKESDYNQKYYQRNKEKILRRRHKQAKQKREFITKYKLEHGCSICGYNKSARALQFHHINDKKFSLAWATWSKSIATIKDEIEKCVVVCANCHAEIHDIEPLSSRSQDS